MKTRTAAATLIALALLIVGSRSTAPARAQGAPPQAPGLTLPNKADSLKFAVLGDFGTGSSEQYDLAAQMKRVHDLFPFELVTLVGDNLYGSERPQDFKTKSSSAGASSYDGAAGRAGIWKTPRQAAQVATWPARLPSFVSPVEQWGQWTTCMGRAPRRRVDNQNSVPRAG